MAYQYPPPPKPGEGEPIVFLDVTLGGESYFPRTLSVRSLDEIEKPQSTHQPCLKFGGREHHWLRAPNTD